MYSVSMTCLVCFLFPFSRASREDIHDLWEQFKTEYNKSYGADVEQWRRNVFLDNVRYIEQQNVEHESRSVDSLDFVSINQFADLTQEEFVGRMARPVTSRPNRFRSKLRHPRLLYASSPPDEVDWRLRGFVSPVKDQGSKALGSIFAAVGALEGQQRGKLSSLVPLSAQQLYDCCGTGSCSPGPVGRLSPTEYFECVDDIDGVDSDKCYPFDGQCHQCRTSPKCLSVRVEGYSNLDSGNEEALKQAVFMMGPVAAAIDASRPSFRFFSGKTVYSDVWCSSRKVNHFVTIVGYGNQGSTPFWLIKNSWGTSWGDKGFAKILRNENMCGIATEAAYPIISVRS